MGILRETDEPAVLGAQNDPPRFLGGEGFDTIPDSGVARWTFDDADTSGTTAVDVWGSNDATLNGVTTGVSGANQTYATNEAYSFDGTDDDAIAGETISSFPFSISLWVKTTSEGGVLIFDNTSNSDQQSGLWIVSGEFRLYNYDGGFNNLGGNSSVTDGTWHHLIIAVSSSDVVGYLDGGEDWQTTHSESFPTGVDSTLFAITRQTDDADRFAGDMDDPRVYDKQLSPTEAADLYNNGSI